MPRILSITLCGAFLAVVGVLAWHWPRAEHAVKSWEGFQPLGEPAHSEWRAVFQESPQSFAQYRAEVKVRPGAGRDVIVLQPLGAIPSARLAAMAAMREYAEAFFQLPARVAEPLPLDSDAPGLTRDGPSGGKQYNADLLLDDTLKKGIPGDAIAVLGITMEDLYSEDLNYVFGLASTTGRVGIYSLCRYFPEFWGQPATPDTDRLALLRACKVLNHETGHMFGLGHCLYFRCSMNGSNSLPETDATPIHFCPICEDKLTWNIGMDKAAWWLALEGFYGRHGMSEEAKWMQGRRAADGGIR